MHVTEAVRGSREIDEAAQVWAEATAARDGSAEVADLSLSRPVLDAVLARSDRSFVLVAIAGDGTVAGFAAVEPAAGPDAAPDACPARAEVSYLGVRPGRWGQGVGQLLVRELRARLAAAGYRYVQLLVYTDNARAVALYERTGWQPRGRPAPHPRTGRPEQRYELAL